METNLPSADSQITEINQFKWQEILLFLAIIALAALSIWMIFSQFQNRGEASEKAKALFEGRDWS